MQLNKNTRIGLSIGLGLLCLLLMALTWNLGEIEEKELAFSGFLGRFHPLLVHFPIVLVLLSLIAEILNFWKKDFLPKVVPTVLHLAAVLACLLAAYLGYFLYTQGGYAGELVQDHMWAGLWLSIFMSLALIASLFANEKLKWVSLIIANGLLLYTGHLGGSLSHGENYLSEYFSGYSSADSPIMQKSRADILIFDDLVLNVFRAKCLSCHNKNKAKGGLIMESYAALSAGGKSEKALFDSLNYEEGELYKRIHLENTHEEHMPPSGKAQLNEHEIRLLDWWIAEGANQTQILGNEKQAPVIEAAIDAYLPRVANLQIQELEEADQIKDLEESLVPLAKELGFEIERDLDLDPTKFALSMQIPPRPIGDAQLIELLPYAEHISRLSLVSSEVTDEGLYTLGQFSGLERLVLAKTCVNGEGLIYLKDLPSLKSLNLSDTFLDDLGILQLTHLTQLEEVFMLNSEVSIKMRETLNEFLPDLEIKLEEGDLY